MRIALMTEPFLRFVDQATALKYIKEIGFDAADVTLFDSTGISIPQREMFGEDYIEHAKQLKKFADDLELPLIQSHTCFHIYRENDEEYHKNMIEIQKKSIEICGYLGIKNVVIHPWNRWTAEENAIFYRKLLPLAEKHNVTICTENMFNWNKEKDHALLAACSSPEDFLRHIEVVNHPNFGACVDIGHANMFSMVDKEITPENMIKTLGKHVKCFHIHDNDGVHDRHQTPFTMSLDFEKVMQAMKEIDYKGDIVIEICDNDCNTLDEIYEKAKLQLIAGKKLLELFNK